MNKIFASGSDSDDMTNHYIVLNENDEEQLEISSKILVNILISWILEKNFFGT